MADNWSERVSDFVDRLEALTDQVGALLEQTGIDTAAVNASEVERSMGPLRSALAGLQELVAERQQLLAAADAPQPGLSLMEKLRSTGRLDDASLARRCQRLAGRITDVHQRAMSIFVCQFHLAELSEDLVRLISGAGLPRTYGPSSQPGPAAGGLFNKSA